MIAITSSEILFLITVNYGNIIPPNLSKDTNGKLSELQKKLKRVSESHQEERKRLVVTYTSLSQDQGMAGREGKSLQSQLISLSVRHKKLLQLFSIQKEIGSKLEKLEKREASAKKTGMYIVGEYCLIMWYKYGNGCPLIMTSHCNE